jgi:hypothetical protein
MEAGIEGRSRSMPLLLRGSRPATMIFFSLRISEVVGNEADLEWALSVGFGLPRLLLSTRLRSRETFRGF